MNIVLRLINLGFFYFHLILDIIQGWQSHSSRTKNNPYLSGNFAPVKQVITAPSLSVTQGRVPDDLRGEFVRNGPNPVHVPRGGYHWFDGDGMLHGVRLSKNNVSYVNRYVNTARYSLGDTIVPRIGELWGIIGIVKIYAARLRERIIYGARADHITTSVPWSTANTNVFYHSGKMLALVEDQPPTLIKILEDGNLETKGLYDYQGKFAHRAFTAHPKICPITGEAMGFGYSINPGIHYDVISKEGVVTSSIKIKLPKAVMMHDMAITEHYTIFFDLSLVFDPKVMVLQSRIPFVFDRTHPSRIGVIPRHARSDAEMEWFHIAPCFLFHTANAWETKSHKEIVIYGCRSDNFELDQLGGGGQAPFEFVGKDYKSGSFVRPDYQPVLYEWVLNLETGAVSERPVTQECYLEFPRIHPDLNGLPSRYSYIAITSEVNPLPVLEGVAKVELATGRISTVRWPEGHYGSEAVFVPRKGAQDEDDGYLLSFVYRPDTDLSDFVVLDAKTMSRVPVCTVSLPQRVPFGFHGIWVSEEEIRAQLGAEA